MSTVNQALLVAAQQVAASDTVYYTAPPNTTAKIGRAVFVNTTAGAVTITAGVTPAVALAAGNQLISARTVAAGESYVSPELAGAVIPAGSQLRALAGSGAAITLMVSGITIQ
jgi:hypothetical protein